MRARIIQSAGAWRLLASLRTLCSSAVSCGARACSNLGISSLLSPMVAALELIYTSFEERSSSGGLLEWDMWARIDRNRLPRLLKYASIRPQIRLSRVAIGPPPRHQQTTDKPTD